MATPIPGQEAIDNGDGTATTRYSDGSSVVWNITSGAYVSSTPAGGGTAPTTLAGTATPQPSTWNPADPTQGRSAGWGSIGAGTQWTAPGYGVPGFGQAPIPIQPGYQQYLSTAPGYIPGSGTYNQFNLSQPGLVGTVGGVPNTNLRYGQGGTGDPTTGLEAQTPQALVNGPKLFNSTRQANWGQADQAGTGLDYIATLFLRSDTPSGINTAAWSAPDQFWAGLAQQIAAGTIQPTREGWAALAQKGYTPQKIGGAAPAQAAGAASGAGGQGGGDSALQDYYATITANEQAKQAAQLVYQDWMMRTQDDEQAFRHAQQEYENKWTESMFTYQKQKDQWNLQQSAGYFEVDGQRTPTLAGVAQEADLTGTYKGAPTFAREQYQTNTMQNLLGLQASLRGPANYGQYLKVLGSTPSGMRDVVNAAAGRFQMPSTTGQAGQPQSADVQSLLNDVTSGAQGAQQEWQSALSGGLPAPNQISLQNWGRMMPSQQQMLRSAYETQGWDVNDFDAMLKQSAPVGAGGQTGTYRF